MVITLLGAQGSGKTWLARALGTERPDLPIVETLPTAPLRAGDCVLLMGLDLPSAQASTIEDTELRAALARAGIPFQVVYGTGPARLQNAISSIAVNARSAMENLQNGSSEQLQSDVDGRVPLDPPAPHWHWQCDRCSDPNCERHLFTSLTSQRATGAAAARPAG